MNIFSRQGKKRHPNKLVQKHETYLVDKQLANKLKNVKSNLSAYNKKPWRKKSRQKKSRK